MVKNITLLVFIVKIFKRTHSEAHFVKKWWHDTLFLMDFDFTYLSSPRHDFGVLLIPGSYPSRSLAYSQASVLSSVPSLLLENFFKTQSSIIGYIFRSL